MYCFSLMLYMYVTPEPVSLCKTPYIIHSTVIIRLLLFCLWLQLTAASQCSGKTTDGHKSQETEG